MGRPTPGGALLDGGDEVQEVAGVEVGHPQPARAGNDTAGVGANPDGRAADMRTTTPGPGLGPVTQTRP